MMFLPFCLVRPSVLPKIGFFAIVLFLVGCSPVENRSTAGAPFAYNEDTVAGFMGECLAGSTVEQCLCVLDRFRAETSEDAYSALRKTGDYTQAFDRHAAGCGAPSVVSAAPPASGASSPGALPASPVASSPVATPAVPVERQVTNAEGCLQERLAVAAAKAGDGSVPIDEFERIRAACGA
jgi:hypothetical protein